MWQCKYLKCCCIVSWTSFLHINIICLSYDTQKFFKRISWKTFLYLLHFCDYLEFGIIYFNLLEFLFSICKNTFLSRNSPIRLLLFFSQNINFYMVLVCLLVVLNIFEMYTIPVNIRLINSAYACKKK